MVGTTTGDGDLRARVLALAAQASQAAVAPAPGIVDLGRQSAYLGSQGQAAALIEYERRAVGSCLVVTYRTDRDGVAIGYDLVADTLIRAHATTAGGGWCERWGGMVRARIQAAARGTGTFNDTRAGKAYGTREEIGSTA